MNFINSFKNDDSGAVTVDWVVLTAAIVGIGMSVIAAVSTGIESASEEIDGGLEVASNFTFSFDKEGSTTLTEYLEASGGDPFAAYDAVANDAPDGYGFYGEVDNATDTAVYEGSGETTFGTVSVNGEVIDSETYYNDVYGDGGEGTTPVLIF